MKKILLSLAVGLMVAGVSYAGDACAKPAACDPAEVCGAPNQCGRCGHKGCCEKHCKIVCEMKEVKKHVWEVKCEEFCPTLPSCGRNCGCNCGNPCTEGQACCTSCDCGGRKGCDPCAGEDEKVSRMKTPTCGKTRVKKTLVKKEVTCKVPTYKCVVVYTCSSCGCNEGSGEQAAPADAKPVEPPPAPAPRTTQDAPLPPMLSASLTK